MTYSFAGQLARVIPSSFESRSESPPVRAFALIDAGQVAASDPGWQWFAAGASFVPLFKETFASPAIDLSPLLFELAGDVQALTAQILGLDDRCKGLPMMSVLHSRYPLDALVKHLRARMSIEADSVSYMLRFSDSQMLAAANSVFTPHQRAEFFARLSAWFTVDHQGALNDQADPLMHQQAASGAKLPLRLDQAQTHPLLEAAAIRMLASQLRHFEHAFGQRLTHARQIEFVSKGVEVARAAGVDDDSEMVAWLLNRWQAEQEGIA
jgi:hypothetical protein